MECDVAFQHCLYCLIAAAEPDEVQTGINPLNKSKNAQSLEGMRANKGENIQQAERIRYLSKRMNARTIFCV